MLQEANSMVQEANSMVQEANTLAQTVDALESELLGIESQIGRGRARQLELLRALEAASVAALDGARTMVEWTAARLDVAPQMAKDLVGSAHHIDDRPHLARELAAGECSFDRTVATAQLLAVGADDAALAASRGLDITGVRRLAARHRRVTADAERRSFNDRYLMMQPSLDEGHWRLHGRLPGYEGTVVAEALSERGDRVHGETRPDEPRSTRPQRCADALVAMSLDSLDCAGEGPGGGDRTPLVSVFVDAELAARSGGESGAYVAAGPRVGPATLERLLCEGRIEVNTKDGTALAIGPTSRTVPPRLRRFVLHRDGGCVLGGCHSRYRLQAHHVIPAAEGGASVAENLVTLCWYHHHVVVHGQGFRIDPSGPPGRARFFRRLPGRGPPAGG